jgi:hypothetical protein
MFPVLLRGRAVAGLLNQVAMLVGFTVLVMLLLLVYGFLFGGKAAEDPLPNPNQPARLISDESSMEEFSNEIAVASTKDLTNFLKKTWAPKSNPEPELVRIERVRKRLKAAEQLLLLDSSPEEYKLAVQVKLMALTDLYYRSIEGNFRLDVKEDLDQLKRFSESLVSAGDSTLRKDARVVLLNISLVEAAQETESDPQKSIDLIVSFLNDFRAEPKEAADMLGAMFPGILKLNPKFGLNLANGLMPVSNAIEEHRNLFRELRDQALVSATGLIQKQNRAMVGRADDVKELQRISRELAADPQGGAYLLFAVERVAHWFESEQKLKEAKQIYQSLLDTAQNRATQELVGLVTQAAKDGMKRCELVGKKFEFRGNDVIGAPLNPETFNGHLTVLFFFSAENNEISAELSAISERLTKLANRQVRFIVIFMETKSSHLMEDLVLRYPLIRFVLRSDDSEQLPSMYSQYPSHQVPQAILVNPEGQVFQIAVRPIDVFSIVNHWLDTYELKSKPVD